MLHSSPAQFLFFLLLTSCCVPAATRKPEAGLDATATGSGQPRFEGAYYREEQGSLSASCTSNSMPPVTRRGYREKFSFRSAANDSIQVQHWDAVCSDMFFPAEEYAAAAFAKLFQFSPDGLTLSTEKALKAGARFQWQAADPE